MRFCVEYRCYAGRYLERNDEEIILSKNDKHLCFWVGIYCSQPIDGWQEASGRVMEKCGFVDTDKKTLCPGLEIGGDKPVRIMRLDYAI